MSYKSSLLTPWGYPHDILLEPLGPHWRPLWPPGFWKSWIPTCPLSPGPFEHLRPPRSPLWPLWPLNNPLFLQQIIWIYGLKLSINLRTCPDHLALLQRTWVVNGEGIRKRCSWCDFDVIAPQRLGQTFATKLVSANCCTKHANFVNPLVLRTKWKISKNVSSFSLHDLHAMFLPSREPFLNYILFYASL